MRVKTVITFKVEYPLDLDFYNTDEEKALEMERASAAINPLEIIESFEARGEGTFGTSVEIVKDETK